MEFFVERNLSVESYHTSSMHRAVIFLSYIPLILLITLGNALVIATIITRRRLRTQNYFILTSLAVNDFLTGVVSVPLETHLRTVRSRFTCSLATTEYIVVWTYVFLFGSMTHLLLISADRYIAVTRPLRYESIVTARRIAYALAIGWCVPIAYSVARLTLSGDAESKRRQVYSYCSGGRSAANAVPAWLDYIVPGSVCIVGALLIFLNIRILVIALRQANRIAEMTRALEAQNMPTYNDQGTLHIKAAKIILSMVFGFVLSFVPAGIFLLVARDIESTAVYMTTDDISYFMICFSGAMNPILYCSRDRIFRENAVGFLLSLKGAIRRVFTGDDEISVST